MAQVVQALCYKTEGCGFDSRLGHGRFIFTYSFRPHYATRVDSASNTNGYQEFSLWYKDGRCVRLTTYYINVLSRNVWSLNPSVALRTCPDIYRDIYLLIYLLRTSNLQCAGIAQSAQRLATAWTVRGSNPGGGEIFRTTPDRPWGSPSLLYNGYRAFPRVKSAGAWR